MPYFQQQLPAFLSNLNVLVMTIILPGSNQNSSEAKVKQGNQFTQTKIRLDFKDAIWMKKLGYKK